MQNPKVLLLCLHGGNEPETRIRSVYLFRQFMIDNEIACPVTDYIDSHGYWVFCLVMFVTDSYILGSYAEKWGNIMLHAGIPGATNYERLMDFDEFILEGECF